MDNNLVYIVIKRTKNLLKQVGKTCSTPEDALLLLDNLTKNNLKYR